MTENLQGKGKVPDFWTGGGGAEKVDWGEDMGEAFDGVCKFVICM
jgi:hypothetical protein